MNFKLIKLIAVLVAISAILACESKGEYEIEQLKISPRWTIDILAANDVEASQSIYYRVSVDNKVVVPVFRICGGHAGRGQQFKFIAAKEGTLVGVYEARFPEEILALHDFVKNETWPSAVTSTLEEQEEARQNLLGQLKKEHPNLNLKTGDGAGCS